MEDLIKALQIFMKYKNVKWPTNCTHDVMTIMDITREEVTKEDVEELDRLGFMWDETDEGFISFRFGSA
jgi:hypothetical protein